MILPVQMMGFPLPCLNTGKAKCVFLQLHPEFPTHQAIFKPKGPPACPDQQKPALK